MGHLRGIGVKTLGVVLMFTCGRDVFPVDTHVHRVCRRLGLIDEAMRWFDATLQMERAKGDPEIIRRTRDRWGEARDLARAKRAAP